jgi:metal-responsive CopG/Arc/MetJ family transcriptional regulator
MRSVCIRLSDALLRLIDELVEKLGYTSRSDLIRDAIRALIREKIRELMILSQVSREKSKIIEEVKKIG